MRNYTQGAIVKGSLAGNEEMCWSNTHLTKVDLTNIVGNIIPSSESDGFFARADNLTLW